MKFKNVVIGLGVLLASLGSQAAVITFDEQNIGATVDDFYAGGGGPNFGASFTASDWTVSDVGPGFGLTSLPNFAFSRSGTGMVNIAAGFTGMVSFTYGAFVDATVSIFDGAAGTGNLLASISLAANDPSAFDPASITFAGTGYSIAVVGGPDQFGWDDLTFNEVGTVPEPGSLALLGLGLAGIAGLRRKQLA